MTNEELLAGFLDRTLTAEQLQLFELRKAENADFAEEVRQMVATEELLTNAAPTVRYPVAFFQQVEQSIVAKILAAGAVTSVGVVAVKTWLPSFWGWITLSASAVAVGGSAIWFATRQQQQPSPVAKQPAVVQQTQQAPPVAPQTQVQPQPELVAPQQGSVRVVNSQDVVTNLKQELEVAKTLSDKTSAMQLCRALGVTLRQRSAFNESSEYFQSALAYAQQLAVPNFEIDMLGEIAVLEQTRGNNHEAQQRLLTLVALGKKHGIDVQQWQQKIPSR
jgi:hypothetical protein